MYIEVFDKRLEVHSFGAQSVFEYGICNEVNVVEAAEALSTQVSFTRLLLVDGREFFFDQKTGKVVENGSSSEILVDLSSLPVNDEQRVAALLNFLGIETANQKLDQFFVISFGNQRGQRDCTSCWTNRGCALTFCGTDCSWSDGCSY
ncbi:MAG: hypothetical protein AAGE37_00025 [Pseudomonadota bacterium]